MMTNRTPLSMAEVAEYVKKDEEKANVVLFIKKFTDLTSKQAKEMEEKLKSLDLMKINDSGISKIIDLLPETPEEVNKIFTDVGLDEDETNKIIEIVKQFK